MKHIWRIQIDYRPADFGEEGNNFSTSKFTRFVRWVSFYQN